MSLDSFKVSEDTSSTETPNEEYEYSNGPRSTNVPESLAKVSTAPSTEWSTDLSPKYFGAGTPNLPPGFHVDNRVAVDIHILDDPQLVEEVAEFMFPSETERYVEVAKVIFNDMSTWHLPLPPWDKDYTGFRDHIVREYIPDVIKAQVDLAGGDGDMAKHKWEVKRGNAEAMWESDVGDCEMSESTRNWFNENKDWVPKLDKKVESMSDEVSLDIEDSDSWEDDW